MGSKTDEALMQECSNWLTWFGIENNMVVASARRSALLTLICVEQNPHKVRDLMCNGG